MLSLYLSCPALEGIGYKVQIAAIGDRSPLVSGVKVQARVDTRASDPTSREAGSRLFHAKDRADPCPPPFSPLLPLSLPSLLERDSSAPAPAEAPGGSTDADAAAAPVRSALARPPVRPPPAAPAPSRPSGGASSPGPARRALRTGGAG